MKHNRKLVSLFLLVLSLFALSLAAAAADNVVFLATGGTGDGSSPDAPIGRLTAAMDALDLSRDDATVVLVGEFKQTTFFAYTEEFSGTVTITAVYDGVDYRTVYSAHKAMGGGVTIDLIHEWDYLVELFGVPDKLYNFKGTYSDLEIDSDMLRHGAAVENILMPRAVAEDVDAFFVHPRFHICGGNVLPLLFEQGQSNGAVDSAR